MSVHTKFVFITYIHICYIIVYLSCKKQTITKIVYEIGTSIFDSSKTYLCIVFFLPTIRYNRNFSGEVGEMSKIHVPTNAVEWCKIKACS